MKIAIDKFEDWLRNKNLKESTISNYIYYFNKFTDDVFTQETISKFLSLKENRNSVGRSFLVNLQKYLKTNYEELGISKELRTKIIEVELPVLSGRSKQRLIKPIPHDQIHLLEKHLPTEKLKLQFLLSYNCGLRLGELLKIRITSFKWVEWKKDESKFADCFVLGKGDKEGIALVPPELMERIRKYILANEWTNDGVLFGNPSGSNKLETLSREWQLSLREAGIKSGITKLGTNGKVIDGTAVYPHRLRHSFADYMLNHRGLNLREVQELLRHSSIQSTQLYTYINKEALKEKLNK